MCEINSNLKHVSVWNIHMITLLFPWTKLCDWQAECYLHNLKEGLIPGSENLLIVFWYLYPTEVFVHKTTITKGQLQVLHLNNFNSFSAETCSQLHQQSYVFWERFEKFLVMRKSCFPAPRIEMRSFVCTRGQFVPWMQSWFLHLRLLHWWFYFNHKKKKWHRSFLENITEY